MKYISVDIETTGLNPDYCQILEFAAIIDDLNIQAPVETLPKFHTYVMHERYIGEPYALALNTNILKTISDWQNQQANFCTTDNLIPKFHTFLTTLGGYSMYGALKINIAGKNFGNFDNRFLEKLPYYNNLVKINHRIVDPVMLFFNPEVDINELPSTKQCMERAGISGDVRHTALEDAEMVVKLLRNRFPKGEK